MRPPRIPAVGIGAVKSPTAKRGETPAYILLAWGFAIAFITTTAIFTALQSETSGLRTVLRRRYGLPSLGSASARYLHVASVYFAKQSKASTERLAHLLDSHQQYQARNSTTSQSGYDVCPVILSTVPREVPHWIWTVSSVHNGFAEEQAGNATYATTFAPPTVFWRPGSAFDHLSDSEVRGQIHQLLERGLLRRLLADSHKYMPSIEHFKYVMRAPNRYQAEHFAQQAFDHVVAMEDCHNRGCKYCLILEDDIMLSSGWRRRVSDAIAITKDTGSLLKLFELDIDVRISNRVEGWERDDAPLIALGGFGMGTLAAGLFHRIVVHRSSVGGKSQGQSCLVVVVLWVGFVLWATVLIVINGQNVLLSDTFETMVPRQQERTWLRSSTYPIRGAVANMYGDADIPNLVLAIKDLIWYLSDASSIPSSDGRLEFAKRFLSRFPFSYEPLRIDVIVAKYFVELRKPILVVEPNVVQHIGFVSTEPYRKAPFTAMSSTFEDGNYMYT